MEECLAAGDPDNDDFKDIPPHLIRRGKAVPPSQSPRPEVGHHSRGDTSDGSRSRSNERLKGGAGARKRADKEEDEEFRETRKGRAGTIRRGKEAAERNRRKFEEEKKKKGGEDPESAKSRGKEGSKSSKPSLKADMSKSPSARSRRKLSLGGEEEEDGGKDSKKKTPKGKAQQATKKEEAKGAASSARKQKKVTFEEEASEARKSKKKSKGPDRKFSKYLGKEQEATLMTAIRALDVKTSHKDTDETLGRLNNTIANLCGLHARALDDLLPGDRGRLKQSRKLRGIMATIHDEDLVSRPLVNFDA